MTDTKDARDRRKSTNPYGSPIEDRKPQMIKKSEHVIRKPVKFDERPLKRVKMKSAEVVPQVKRAWKEFTKDNPKLFKSYIWERIKEKRAKKALKEKRKKDIKKSI